MNIVRSPETSRSDHLVTHRHHLRVGNFSIKTFKISHEVYNKCRNILFVFFTSHFLLLFFLLYGTDQYIKHNHQQHELYGNNLYSKYPVVIYINYIRNHQFATKIYCQLILFIVTCFGRVCDLQIVEKIDNILSRVTATLYFIKLNIANILQSIFYIFYIT